LVIMPPKFWHDIVAETLGSGVGRALELRLETPKHRYRETCVLFDQYVPDHDRVVASRSRIETVPKRF
jgi:hypothetical protein